MARRVMSKRPRTPNDAFDVQVLINALTPYAQMKVTPWGDWEMSRYTKARKSQGPDRDGLVRYGVLMTKVLEVCPHGFPLFARLREVFLYLQSKYSIMDPVLVSLGKTTTSWAEGCAESLRLLLKHCVDLRRQGSEGCSIELQHILANVVLFEEETPRKKDRALAPQSSSTSSVILRSFLPVS